MRRTGRRTCGQIDALVTSAAHTAYQKWFAAPCASRGQTLCSNLRFRKIACSTFCKS